MNGNQLLVGCTPITQTSMVTISGSNISDITGIQYFTVLTSLNVYNTNVSSLPALPPNLQSLSLNTCAFTAYPNNIPNTITTLKIRYSTIAAIPSLPPNLTTLEVKNSPITALPPLPASLQYLTTSYCNISALPPLPAGLKSLQCDNNPILALPTLPSGLQTLNAQSCQLTSLPGTLPPMLKYLNCTDNIVNTLPPLPAGLQQLSCAGCQISSIPPIPNTLTYLDAHNNQLINLPFLPDGLGSIDASYNQLTSFLQIPQTCYYLDVEYNPLTCFGVFPSNPNLYVFAAGVLATCLPNRPAYSSSNLSMLPFCSLDSLTSNPFGCNLNTGISGTIFYDANSNCLLNGQDIGGPNFPVKVYDNAGNFWGATTTMIGGYYFLNCPSGNWRVVMDTANLPITIPCNQPGIDTTISLSSTSPLFQSADFPVDGPTFFDLGIISVQRRGQGQIGRLTTYKVKAGDLAQLFGLPISGNTSGQLSLTYSGPITLSSSNSGSLSPNVTGNTITYNIPNFIYQNINQLYYFHFITDTSAQIGDSVRLNISISPTIGDNNPANNILTAVYPYEGPYDPNSKEVYPSIVGPNYNGWLNYTIHFQNIGNAPAINVRLEDTLAANLDWSTFQFIDASHYQTHRLEQNRLVVYYPNIQLPDSLSDPDGSQGYFQFRIKPKSGLGVGTTIENSAAIYFDYNAPVITNTATTEYQLITAIPQPEQNPVRVFPNPGTGIFNVEFPTHWQDLTWQISDITGRIVQEGIAHQPYQIDLSQQAHGFYLLKVTTDGKSFHTRLIKE